ncbi:hypothetical protein FO519_000229 [Halicephalobus sp. NKZ332]|nr:hypothetical protein FO519_000229 [Halicephalobus sp. NKZ332]
MMKNFVLFFIALFSICQGWEIKLSPNPEAVSIGQRPAGTPIAIMCTISGLPENSKPKIIWTKFQAENDGNENIFTTGHVNVRNLDPFTTSLVIQNGSLDDNGVYICKGSFNREEKQVNIDINFFEELHFEDNVLEIDSPQEGVAVNLSCRVQQTYQAELVTMWEKGIVALTPSKCFFFQKQLSLTNLSSSRVRKELHVFLKWTSAPNQQLF